MHERGGSEYVPSPDHSIIHKRPADRYHSDVQHFQQTKSMEMAYRSARQEEVLGYDNTMLYSRASLSEQAKAIARNAALISKDKSGRRNNDSCSIYSDDSSLESMTSKCAPFSNIYNDECDVSTIFFCGFAGGMCQGAWP
eukprot:CAMPEP_0181084828 /NCGR_PEP_ID=MMETSP1071-20121207/4902_1 /TAXON_ID=35127 /ORGANISM="Thalassiosira sp., Strain NH16" /LENGTH=139 /DNA_ID=CAMNT_0023166585 /DNA_START=123 /DNA_END=542 /DNA_ORIENTATION=-